MSLICCFSVFTVAWMSVVTEIVCPASFHAAFDASFGRRIISVTGPGWDATNCASGTKPTSHASILPYLPSSASSSASSSVEASSVELHLQGVLELQPVSSKEVVPRQQV